MMDMELVEDTGHVCDLYPARMRKGKAIGYPSFFFQVLFYSLTRVLDPSCNKYCNLIGQNWVLNRIGIPNNEYCGILDGV